MYSLLFTGRNITYNFEAPAIDIATMFGFIKNQQGLVLEKFAIHFNDLYGDSGEAFVEEEGRKYFLLYLRPIINGAGNYYIEARTREFYRIDIIVDYHGEQFVIEIKIWRADLDKLNAQVIDGQFLSRLVCMKLLWAIRF